MPKLDWAQELSELQAFVATNLKTEGEGAISAPDIQAIMAHMLLAKILVELKGLNEKLDSKPILVRPN